MTENEPQPAEIDPAPEDSEAAKEREGSGGEPPDVEETFADPKATPAAGGAAGEEGSPNAD